MTLFIPTGTPQALPDPTLNAGVAYTMIDGDDVDTVFTSVGATPFSTDGVLSATVTVPGGAFRSFRSDGVHWIVDTGGAVPLKSFRGSGVSDASGNVVFNMSAAGFAAAPVVTNAIQTALTDATECRITALSATSVTFNVRRAPAVVILGISVLQVPVPAVGVTVHCLAFPSGSQS